MRNSRIQLKREIKKEKKAETSFLMRKMMRAKVLTLRTGAHLEKKKLVKRKEFEKFISDNIEI